MKEPLHTNERIDRELTGETVSTGRCDITPVARLQGRWGINESEGHQFGYVWLKMKPVKIAVRDTLGRTDQIELTDVNAQAATSTGMIALGIAAVCLFISVVRKLFH